MIRLEAIKKSLRNFTANEKGNFAITSALLLPVLFGTVGIAIDIANVMQFKTKLQAAADSAALAGASALAAEEKTADQAKLLSKEYLTAHLNNGALSVTDSGTSEMPTIASPAVVTVTEEPYYITGKKFTVKVDSSYNVPLSGLSRLIGFSSMTVSVSSKTESNTKTKSALSMYFVLDRSGSMGSNTSTTYTTTCVNGSGVRYSCTKYYTKMASLQMAVGSLLGQLLEADPDRMYVRTAAVSYNQSMQTATELAWGTTGVGTYVNALTATGNTDSSAATEWAYQKVKAASEDTIHAAKNGKAPARYIVLMTDGENNIASADTKTKKTCDAARANGVEVFTVAFMAPTAGQNLLKYCATSPGNYFPAENTTDLIKAFKTIGEKASEAMTRLTN